LKPLIVENEINSDGSMQTNLVAIRELMELYGERILCVLSTTSCFAPRQPDVVDEIAKLCKANNIGHVINNAYGVQCPYITKLINRACLLGRVDVVVQSTDKNFMVPVGGAIISSPSQKFISEVSAIYPGRASAAPIMDLFITLLSMGENGYRSLLLERARVFKILADGLNSFAATFGENIVPAPRNGISIAVTLSSLDSKVAEGSVYYEKAQDGSEGNKSSADSTTARGGLSGESESSSKKTPSKMEISTPTFFGAMLFQRCISGCRVVSKSSKAITTINGYNFASWGAHSSAQSSSYFTAACAIGLLEEDVQVFLDKLTKTFRKLGLSPSI